MYVNALAALVLLTPALANPVGSDSTDNWSDSTDSDLSALSDYADNLIVPTVSVPDSILSVLETAVPVSWYEELMDPSSYASIMSDIEAGTFPAWYIALPSSVKAWAISEAELDFLSITDAGSISSEATVAPQATAKTTPLNVAVTNTAAAIVSSVAPTSDVASSSSAKSTSHLSSEASSQASSSSAPASSATSSGGAPVPTTGVAMGLAGIAGLLGLAIAL
ncbi:hypothetical protein N7478_003498 [Penicillium angulare]|uniref:uncharacterized protein n=1 Tax=Penicillium angulare TaxID=116970 RepID=UPI00253F9DCB|nr:uncharacterized protein N7478_003498 [Penicillium angulare]KAJ5287812.1 hypothetical protein N7478_003498 [Penicillium angulare]